MTPIRSAAFISQKSMGTSHGLSFLEKLAWWCWSGAFFGEGWRAVFPGSWGGGYYVVRARRPARLLVEVGDAWVRRCVDLQRWSSGGHIS